MKIVKKGKIWEIFFNFEDNWQFLKNLGKFQETVEFFWIVRKNFRCFWAILILFPASPTFSIFNYVDRLQRNVLWHILDIVNFQGHSTRIDLYLYPKNESTKRKKKHSTSFPQYQQQLCIFNLYYSSPRFFVSPKLMCHFRWRSFIIQIT